MSDGSNLHYCRPLRLCDTVADEIMATGLCDYVEVTPVGSNPTLNRIVAYVSDEAAVILATGERTGQVRYLRSIRVNEYDPSIEEIMTALPGELR